MKKIIITIVIILIVWGFISILKKDTFVGFYYPDASNLVNDIQSDNIFDSIEDCRDWIDDQIYKYNPNGSGYDYECGKNCDLTGGKPYICEETLE